MVVFEVTPEIGALLKEAGFMQHCQTLPNGPQSISHEYLVQALSTTGKTTATLLSFARRSKVHRNHVDACKAHETPPRRSRELEERLAVLRMRHEEKQYADIIRGVAGSSMSNAELESARLTRFGAQMSLGVNVVVTMATCFVAGYFVFKHSSGRQSVGLVGGVLCMIVAMAVEITLVITRMYAIDAALEKDGRQQVQRLAASQRQRMSQTVK